MGLDQARLHRQYEFDFVALRPLTIEVHLMIRLDGLPYGLVVNENLYAFHSALDVSF
jgi:hypothetical protein